MDHCIKFWCMSTLTFLYEYINMWFIFIIVFVCVKNTIMSVEIESRSVGMGWKQAWENFWGDENVLKLDCGDGCIATTLLKTVDGYILWYINYNNKFALKIPYWPAKKTKKMILLYHIYQTSCSLKNLLWMLSMSISLYL